MDKKTACCGCGCLVIIIAVIAVIVGGYYGFSFLHSAGKDMAAITFEKTLESITEKAFNQNDRKLILDQANDIAKKLKSGEIGLLRFMQEGSQNRESGLYSKIVLLSFKNHYILEAEEVTDSEFIEKGTKSVNRLIYGLNEKDIGHYEIASISMKITEHFQQEVSPKGEDSKTNFSSRRLNMGLSRDEVQQCLTMIDDVCNRNKIELPEDGYNSDNAVKEEILAIFERLKKPEKEN